MDYRSRLQIGRHQVVLKTANMSNRKPTVWLRPEIHKSTVKKRPTHTRTELAFLCQRGTTKQALSSELRVARSVHVDRRCRRELSSLSCASEERRKRALSSELRVARSVHADRRRRRELSSLSCASGERQKRALSSESQGSTISARRSPTYTRTQLTPSEGNMTNGSLTLSYTCVVRQCGPARVVPQFAVSGWRRLPPTAVAMDLRPAVRVAAEDDLSGWTAPSWLLGVAGDWPPWGRGKRRGDRRQCHDDDDRGRCAGDRRCR